MAAVFSVILFALFSPVLPFPNEEIEEFRAQCPSFTCGNFKNISFPFNNITRPPICGPFVVKGCDKKHQEIQPMGETGRRYHVESINRTSISLIDNEFRQQLNSGPRNQSFCECFNNFTLPNFPGVSIQIIPNITLLKCDYNVNLHPPTDFSYKGCKNFSIHYNNGSKSLPSLPPNCSVIQLPIKDKSKNYGNISELLAAKFTLQVDLKEGLFKCNHDCKIQGQCHLNNKGEFQECTREDKQKKNSELRLILVLGLVVPANIFIMLLAIFLIRRKYKRRYTSANSSSANASSLTSSKSDLSGGEVYFRVPIFSYNELEEATNNFDPRKALGDGGFGTVYYGILRDGREVAVKRPYERNYKRVKQFMNEIEILTRLHHKNLVSLYGCTSQQSRELLLVYEYIPNGTLADHLHGPRAKSSPLSWAIRMTIAVETASSLAYLHASGIIHRDVKSNNILLDSNFCVKVADFGLSRLFPNDVTHASTAPQGTPGYVDPEYHQCYQLTDKSDVYSFGVVLIELISSMPAVDISRHRHEINLANLALNRIQKCAFEDLIDPFLGFQTDEEVKTMTTLVAELAFRCLQQDKEMRPAMDEVLEELKIIASRDCYLGNGEEQHNDYELPKSQEPPASEQHCHEDALLKNIGPPLSPNSITDKWISSGNSAVSNIRSY